MVVYWLFNWFQNKDEIGAEVELAPNRKPQWDDDLLETKRLDMSLTAGLVTLAIIALALPLYWLAEPGRQAGSIEYTEGRYVVAGEELYNENCAQCHGSVDGPGGDRSFTIVDGNGNFVEQVDWRVPSLGAVLYRFSEGEVRYILNNGRTNSPMPAWGAAGGGAMTAQQIDHIIQFIGHEQKPANELAERVESGLPDAAFDKILRDDDAMRLAYYGAVNGMEAATGDAEVEAASDAFKAIEADIEAQAAVLVAQAEDDEILYGELLFTNPADSGSYGCARCHSLGWSYRADEFAGEAEAASVPSLLPAVSHGGGGFGPNLSNGSTLRQFSDATAMAAFIQGGSIDGQKYGNAGQGDGGGQMPAFATCAGDRDTAERKPLEGLCEEPHIMGAGMLTLDQVKAIVAYERNLGLETPAPAPAPEPEPTPEPEEEPEPEPAPTGTVDVTISADNTTEPPAITLSGEVLSEAQHQALVDAANAEYGEDNVTDLLTVSGLDPALDGSDGRVTELATFISTLRSNDVLSGEATLDGDALTLSAIAPTLASQATVQGIATGVAVGTIDATVDVDAATAIRRLDLSGVQFETGTANLTAEAQLILDDAAEQLQAFPEVAVEVQGHTDDIGGDGANQALSQARAESVAAYLANSGVDPDRLTAVGYGESQPIDDNTTAEGRQVNRRVQFEVLEA